jgi:hypothetical protein
MVTQEQLVALRITSMTHCFVNGSFRTARDDPQFSNVKKRVEHYHARCDECVAISNARSRGYRTKADSDHWEQRAATHDALYVVLTRGIVTSCNTTALTRRKLQWRQTETQLMAESRNAPETLCLIRIDDTTAVPLPHVGPRCPKKLHNKNGPEVHTFFFSVY